MGNLETAEDARPALADARAVTVLVGLPASTDAALLRRRAHEAVDEMRVIAPALGLVVAYPGTEGAPEAAEAGIDASTGSGAPLRFIEYLLPQSGTSTVPWLGLAPAYRRLSELAADAGAAACVVLSPDLAAFDARSIQSLAEPLLAARADLAMPLYAPSKYEGLLNSSILYPFTRALYGRRIRYPLAPDFGVSAALLERLGRPGPRGNQTDREQNAVWPATEAVPDNCE